jgi:hypothetical protein
MEDWCDVECLDDLLEKNIKTLYGQSYSPFMFIEPGRTCLYDDTLPNIKIIEDINRKGFLTICSQPSSFEEKYEKYFLDREYEQKNNDQIHREDKKVIDGKKYYKCHQFQKGYCCGLIYKSIFDELKSKIEPNYKLFYYDYLTEEMKDGRENLTYYSFYNRIYRPTNFFEIESNAWSQLNLMEEDVDDDLIEQVKDEMIYIEIIDLDYNTNKNIYQDILSCLE